MIIGIVKGDKRDIGDYIERMNDNDINSRILPTGSNYANVKVNEIKFIQSKQTLVLVLGSCVSTVFIGKKDNYILAANHIFIAEPMSSSSGKPKSAKVLIDGIFTTFEQKFGINSNELICLYLIGGGNKKGKKEFTVNIKNINISKKIVRDNNFDILIEDVRNYYSSSFSISENQLSIFVENMTQNTHISFIIDLDKLFNLFNQENRDLPFLPVSALGPDNAGFEKFIDKKIITFVTGEKNRKYRHIF